MQKIIGLLTHAKLVDRKMPVLQLYGEEKFLTNLGVVHGDPFTATLFCLVDN